MSSSWSAQNQRAIFTVAALLCAYLVFLPALAHGQTPATSHAYVTNFGSDTVSVIDELSNAIVATVSVGSEPNRVAITPDGAFAYVSIYSGNTVSVIATATNSVVATIPVGENPAGVVITPDGAFAYVANVNDNSVSVIATTTNTVVTTIPVGNSPQGIAVTPNAACIYVANLGSNTVSVIATATNSVIATIPVGTTPLDVAITPNGKLAYVSDPSWDESVANSISVIDTTSNSVVATIPVGIMPMGVAITPDGEFVYVGDYQKPYEVDVVATATNSVVATIPVGTNPYWVAVTPSGELAYVANSGDNTLSAIATATNTVVATIPAGASPGWIGLTPILRNTPIGANISVQPIASANGGAPMSLTFSAVTQAGDTTLVLTDTGPAPANSFKIGSPATYYNLATTAAYSGPITICIDFTGISFSNPDDVSMWHYDANAASWTELASTVDSTANTVCASSPSLSPFVLLEPIQMSQTITFGPIPAQVVGTISLAATASSGLPISFASLTPSVCTVSGASANLAAPGTCTIQASQTGNGSYLAATPVNQSFQVSAAAFTIAPKPISETITRGNVAAFVLELDAVNGFKGEVTLTCSSSPIGSHCVDLPQTIYLKRQALAVSGVTFPRNTADGTYTVIFTGVSGSYSATASAQFTVK